MDKKELGFIIRKRREALKINRPELADLLGVALSYVTKIENGQANFTIDKLFAIAKNLNLPEYNLLSSETLVPKSLADKEPVIISVFQNELSKQEFDQYLTKDEVRPIRILEDSASLGTGRIVAQEKTKGYALIRKEIIDKKAWTQKRGNEKIICLLAEGDSMKPTIKDGSLLVIDLEDIEEIQNGKIYAIELPDEGVTIKKAYKHKNHLMLFADNREDPNYPKCILLKQKHYPIRGKVIWALNKLS
jgi:transcriptional regulator with XRE-family HTH domain